MSDSIEDKYNIVGRLDRLPVSTYTLLVVSVGFIATFYDAFSIYQFSVVLTDMEKVYVWTKLMSTFTVISVFIGLAIGAVILGRRADRHGRRRILLLTIVLIAIGSIICSLSPNIISFNIGRIITGIGAGGDVPISISYVNEMVPAEKRGRLFSIMILAITIALPLASFIARTSIADLPKYTGWRVIFYFSAASVVPFFLVRLKSPESPRFHLVHGDQEKANSIMNRIEETYKRKGIELAEPKAKKISVSLEKTPISMLFTKPYWKRSTSMISGYTFFVVAHYSFILFLPSFLVAEGFGVVRSLTYATISYAGGILGPTIMFALGERFERRHTMSVYGGILVVLMILFISARTALEITAVAFFINAFDQALAGTMQCYEGEIWPTGMRATGIGFAGGVGRLVNAGAIFLFVGILGAGLSLQISVIEFCWIGMIIFILLIGINSRSMNLERVSDAALKQVPAD